MRYQVTPETDLQALVDSIPIGDKNIELDFLMTSEPYIIDDVFYPKVHNKVWKLKTNGNTIYTIGKGFYPVMDGVWKVNPKNAEKKQGVNDILQHMDRWVIDDAILNGGNFLTTVGTLYNKFSNIRSFSSSESIIVQSFGMFSDIHNIHMANMDKGIQLVHGAGYLANGNANNSGSNQCTLRNIRLACKTGTEFGLMVRGSNGIKIDQLTIEGGAPKIGLLADGTGASTMKSIEIDRLHVECKTSNEIELLNIGGYDQCTLDKPYIQSQGLIKLNCNKNIIKDEQWINNDIECSGEFYGVRPTNIDKFRFKEIPNTCVFDTGRGVVALGKNGLASAHQNLEIKTTTNKFGSAYGYFITTENGEPVEFQNNFDREVNHDPINKHADNIGDEMTKPAMLIDKNGVKADYERVYKRK